MSAKVARALNRDLYYNHEARTIMWRWKTIRAMFENQKVSTLRRNWTHWLGSWVSSQLKGRTVYSVSSRKCFSQPLVNGASNLDQWGFFSWQIFAISTTTKYFSSWRLSWKCGMDQDLSGQNWAPRSEGLFVKPFFGATLSVRSHTDSNCDLLCCN